MNKRILTVLVPFAAWMTMATVSAQTPVFIPILNPFFSEDQTPCSPGRCAYGNITAWLCGPNTVVQKMSTVQFPSAPAAGLYVAGIGNSSTTGSILQTLGDSLQANVTYTLKVTVGARADYPFTGYEAALMAGGVIVASGNKATPVGGGFVTEIILYSSGATPAQLGKPLQIIVKSLGTGQVVVAAVTLTMQ